VVSGDNWSYKTCKAPVNINKPTPIFIQAGCPSCRPTNSVKALKGKSKNYKYNYECMSVPEIIRIQISELVHDHIVEQGTGIVDPKTPVDYSRL